MSGHESAYDRHWRRLADLLGTEEAAAERARMTADERADSRRRKSAKFRKELPRLMEYLAIATRDHRHEYAERLRKQIAYRERVISEAGKEHE